MFGVVSHHERVSALFWVGAIAGVTALAIYAWSHGGSEGGDPVADVLLVLAVLSSATGYSEGAKLTRLMPGWHVVSWCVIFLLPLSLVGTVTSVALTQSNYSVTLPPVLAPFQGAEWRWVQEEPANQGAWSFIAINLPEVVNRPVSGVSRPASSSPAVGTHQRHEQEQRAVVEQAFA